jgi:hypothetical protein
MLVHATRLNAMARAAAVTVLTAGAVLVPTAAHATHRMSAMTFTVVPASATQGDNLQLTGRAGVGSKGNKATVVIAFRKAGSGTFQRVATTSASGRGTWSATVQATATGTYRAFYRGNAKRKPVTRYDDVLVYKNATTTVTLLDVARVEPDCLTAKCMYTGPTLTLSPGPIHVTFTGHCDQPKSGRSFAFTDSPENILPPTTTYPVGDGWRAFPYGVGPAVFDLTPSFRTGHFRVSHSSGRYIDNAPTGCSWSAIATQTVGTRVLV